MSKDQIEFARQLFETMTNVGSDFTNTFRSLSEIRLENLDTDKPQDQNELIEKLYKESASPLGMAKPFKPKIEIEKLKHLMNRSFQMALFPPEAQQFIKKQADLYKKFESLKSITVSEKKERDSKLWKGLLDQYLSLIKKDFHDMKQKTQISKEEYQQKRVELMNRSNPRFILRNWILQRAIKMAENGNLSHLHKLLILSHDPFGQNKDLDFEDFCDKPSDTELDICVSCSS